MGSYPVIIGNGLDSAALLAQSIITSKVLIVCDETVAKLHLAKLQQNLATLEVQTLVLPSGEVNKNFATVEKIIDKLIACHYDRTSTLISFGGGVIGDITGFAAAIYMRGLRWVQIPTTLMAQVDSAMGGKTGCNYAGIKNLIGVFKQPDAIITDIAYLNTLPEREYLSGLAEVVKYGMALDHDFFVWCEHNVTALKHRDPQILEAAITHSSKLKLDLVQRDETDQNERQKLNFGHTYAHAIEAATNFKVYLHGEAVAIGMVLETRLAVTLGLVQQEVVDRLYKILCALSLPTSVDPEICTEDRLNELMQMDKKNSKNNAIKFILPSRIGSVKDVNRSYTLKPSL